MSPLPEPVPPPPGPAAPRAGRQDAGRRRGVGKRFLVVGDVLDGVLVRTTAAAMGVHDPGAVIRHRPVGAAGNVATWLGWLGADVDLVARVGVDDVHRHERSLTDAGVRAHLRYDARTTTGALVSVQNDAGRTTMSDPAASGVLCAEDVPDELVDRADIVHLTGAAMLGGGADRIAELVGRARTGGARVSLDPSSAAVVRAIGSGAATAALTGVDVLFPNVPEALALTGTTRLTEALRRLTDVVPLVVVTTGVDGAVVGRPGRSPLRVPAVVTTAVDTIGVGDAFAAGFLRAWATDPVRVGCAAQEGARLAARALGFVGGRPPV
ncbi:PfkB family carbohydrate kinase [Curtobacterium sp. MCSS17_007]|uniref:carbohydrate kinase family protein n=1 Tax=Curtobacterium sp. MCSS17_007 TaxID=2175646 RepID=UPI0015E8E7C8|nr:PfkB family carbohydrate kinase [Curtobacterium sp. MCSS17_007]WIE74802.1 PfkB family carbohydrate kinase [Curtobacterium sp. MCSS17_007]